MRELSAEYGLHPAEVRAELEEITEHVRKYGPCTPERAVGQCAEAFGLPEAELWAEHERITGTAGTGR